MLWDLLEYALLQMTFVAIMNAEMNSQCPDDPQQRRYETPGLSDSEVAKSVLERLSSGREMSLQAL